MCLAKCRDEKYFDTGIDHQILRVRTQGIFMGQRQFFDSFFWKKKKREVEELMEV